MSLTVATRYARALFELGAETGTSEALVADIERAAEAYAASPELQLALENPLLGLPAKKGIISDVSDALRLSPMGKNALFLLTERRRLRVLPAIARRLREFGDVSKGLVHAEVITAAPLSDAYYSRLQNQLEKMTGKKVVLDTREDPSLIAGVITRIGDTVYDGSLRSRLESLKTALLPN